MLSDDGHATVGSRSDATAHPGYAGLTGGSIWFVLFGNVAVAKPESPHPG